MVYAKRGGFGQGRTGKHIKSQQGRPTEGRKFMRKRKVRTGEQDFEGEGTLTEGGGTGHGGGKTELETFGLLGTR